MGLIPIHIYSDMPWVPYEDLFTRLGFMNHYDQGIDALLTQLQYLSAAQIVERERHIVNHRHSHFSVEGIMVQIQRFMLNQVNDLKCQKLPFTVRGE